MRATIADAILNSCDEAEKALIGNVPESELPLRQALADYINLFKTAATPGHIVNAAQLKDTVTRVFWLSSNDMLPVMSKCPETLRGLQALRPAASGFYDRVYN